MEDSKSSFCKLGSLDADRISPVGSASDVSPSLQPRLKPRSTHRRSGVQLSGITQAMLAKYVALVQQSQAVEQGKKQLRQQLMDLYDAHGEVQKGPLFFSINNRPNITLTSNDLRRLLGAETVDWLRGQIRGRTSRVVRVTGATTNSLPGEVCDGFDV